VDRLKYMVTLIVYYY